MMFRVRVLLTLVLLSLYSDGVLSSDIYACPETQTCAQEYCPYSNLLSLHLKNQEVCSSHDREKIECGEYAAIPNAKCPLNACCSKDGFCGTTESFDRTGCQSGCGNPPEPKCKTSFWTARQRRVGYYQASAYTREPYGFFPFLIDARKWTHLSYAFASVDPITYQVAQMNDHDTKLYTDFTSLKEQNPALKVYISIGGDTIFSAMASSRTNRAAFIRSALMFMRTYAFDSIDIDWKYPTVEDQANFVAFVQELRAATKTEFGITVVLPASYEELKGFDVVNLEPYVDWFNLLPSNENGSSGDGDKHTPPIQAHINMIEIDNTLDILWRSNIKPSKVVLGLAFHGRSFTLKDPKCNKPGCPSLGVGKPGEYTNTAGVLSWNEIRDLIYDRELESVLDRCVWVKYVTWDDQWVSFDDAETLAMKVTYANSKCLGGTAVWSVDLDAYGDDSGINALLSDNGKASADMRATLNHDNGATLGVFWTPCLPPQVWASEDACPPGYHATYHGHGKVFDADLTSLQGQGCRGSGRQGFMRVLCVEDTLKLECQWGPGARSRACNSLCPAGWITLTKNSHIGGQDIGCKAGRYAPLCCQAIRGFHSGGDVCYSDVRNQHFAGGLGLKGVLGNGRSYRWVSGDGKSEHEETRTQRVRDGENLGLRLEESVDLVGGCPGAIPRDQLGLDIPAVLYNTTHSTTV